MSPVVSSVPLVALPPSARQRRLDSARAVAHRRRTPLRRRLLAVRYCDPAPGAARRKRASCPLSPKTLRRGQKMAICESRWLPASFSQSARMRKPSSQHTACRVAFFLVVSRLTYRRLLSTTSGNRAERDFSRWLPNLVRILKPTCASERPSSVFLRLLMG